MDGDTFFTTDNPVILRNVHPTKAIMCVQSASTKCVPTEKDFVKANKRSFGNLVGTITNYATSMYTVIVNFEQGSEEYNELEYRIACMQDFQQNSIDMAKGIEYRPVPKEWYDWKANKILPDDDEETIKMKEFNQRILANKKPYFMVFNYDKLKREYNQYAKANEVVCNVKFNMSIEELRDKKDKTPIQQENYNIFALQCPVNVSPSVINKIAWHIEKHFAQVNLFKIEEFDTNKLKDSTVEYSTRMYNKVAELREEYNNSLQTVIKKDKRQYIDKETQAIINKILFDNFKEQVIEVCNTVEVACNVLVDLCYRDSKSKDLLWELCGEQLIKNLIKNGFNKIHFPIHDDNGDITFKGMKFKMEEVNANGFNWERN